MAALPKNKRVIIMLVLATLVIWGTIIYKVMNVISAKPSKANTSIAKPLKKEKTDEDYTISYYERDPFLSILTDTATFVDEPKIKDIPQLKPIINYPKPEYCGQIKNDVNTLAIIKIDGRYHMLEKGQKDSLLKVLNVRDTVITILYHNEKLTLHLRKNNSNTDSR